VGTVEVARVFRRLIYILTMASTVLLALLALLFAVLPWVDNDGGGNWTPRHIRLGPHSHITATLKRVTLKRV
jgi:hypothetical protein